MMMFTKVDEVPRYRTQPKVMNSEFEHFMSLNTKIARVIFDGHAYSNVKSAQNSLTQAAMVRHLPIKVMQRSGEIYFVRTDM